MIISKIMGGLGNQMFQYAYAKNISLLNNTELYLDTKFFEEEQSSLVASGVGHRLFTLTKFPNLTINLKIPESLPNLHTLTDTWVFSSNSIPNDNYFLYGYWQSEKYFKESKDTIITEFSPNNKIIKKLTDKYPQINTTTISMHIRRTDALRSDFHPVQNIEYYENALDILGEYDNIFVFSDDISWCKDNMNFNNMIFVEDNSDIEDLWLMSLCKKNIIVNSSFSWWGAYLNRFGGKEVVAPINWFGPSANINTGDIIPEEWHKL